MNLVVRGTRLGLAAGVAAILAGCGSSGTSAPQSNMGTLSLSISDAPIDAAKVCIKFDGVQLRRAEEDPWIEVDFGDPVVINLLANQGAVSETLVSAEIEAGTYSQIRLMVDAVTGNGAGLMDTDPTEPECMETDTGSYLVMNGGGSLNLRVPSGDQTGLKLIKDVTIPVNSSGNYTAEWDLGRSFLAPPGLGTGEALMNPVIKLVADNEVGALDGMVADALASPDPVDPDVCDTENGFGPSIYVFDDNGVANDAINGEENAPIEPVATGLVAQEMQGMPYTYEIGFLLAGDYEVAFTCDGINFIPESGKPAAISVGAVKTVDFVVEDIPVE